MKTTTLTITPEQAEEMLKGNVCNRPLNEAHVRVLMREMQNGRWKLNGDTICLNGSRLIDGQHRLEACRRAGVPFTTIVVEGLSEDVFDTKDCGKRRSASDTLSLRGERNTARLAATLQFVDRYMTGRMETFVRYTNTEVEELLVKYPGARVSVSKCINDTKRLLPFSVLAGCHYLFAQKDAVLADRVIEMILKGANLQEGEPMYVLRERLLQNSMAKAKLSGPYLAALFIKAWNHVRSGNRVRFLRYRELGENPEPFPVVR